MAQFRGNRIGTYPRLAESRPHGFDGWTGRRWRPGLLCHMASDVRHRQYHNMDIITVRAGVPDGTSKK